MINVMMHVFTFICMDIIILNLVFIDSTLLLCKPLSKLALPMLRLCSTEEMEWNDMNE